MAPSIEVRNLKFDLSRVPRHWHPRGRGVTAYWDQFSLFFPAGENFFVRSTRHFLPKLEGDALKRDVAAFAAQEGFHGREHLTYNRRLEAWYPAKRIENLVAVVLAWFTAHLPAKLNLSMTAATEHFTSLMAEFILRDDKVLQDAPKEMASLWRWHAAEESEHRAVTFDVFVAAGGGYFTRVLGMVLISTLFMGAAWAATAAFFARNGDLFNVREWWRLTRYLYLDEAIIPRHLGGYLAYYRPSFHPLQHGNDALIAAWKAAQAP